MLFFDAKIMSIMKIMLSGTAEYVQYITREIQKIYLPFWNSSLTFYRIPWLSLIFHDQWEKNPFLPDFPWL